MRDPVFRYLRNQGCRPSLAEDITQESFLRLHRALRDGLRVHDVRAWVFRVARNLCIDDRREYRRYWKAGQEEGDPLDLAHDSSSPDPERQAIERQMARLLEEHVLRLPELQRECLRLKAQGLRYHEIAAALGISMATAVDSVRRAVKQVRRRLSD